MLVPEWEGIEKFYGKQGNPDCSAGVCKLPYPMLISWDTSKKINSFRCHIKVVKTLQYIFSETLKHYGNEDIHKLKLDMFGGCYMVRRMVGSTRWSSHSWGIAVDLCPQLNQLKWKRERAIFSKPEYEAFWKIVEKNGGVSLGRERNYDWMHFQFAGLP